MRVKEITDIIEAFAPLSLQEEYDNAGLICGDSEREVHSILLTTDITEEVIEEAIEENHGMIISHHPIAIKPLKNLLPDSAIKRCLIKAIQNDIHIYAAHTNIDAVKNGVSGRMADKLELINRSVLKKTGKLFQLSFYTPAEYAEKVRNSVLQAGSGHIGKYSDCSFNQQGFGTFKATSGASPFVGEIGVLHREEEIKTEITVPEEALKACIRALTDHHPYEEPVWNVLPLNNPNPSVGFGIVGELEQETDTYEFFKRVKNTFRCQAIKHTAVTVPRVKKVALCGGAGAFLLPQAIASGADIFLSGDFKYHDFFNAENSIIIVDIGHYESEQFTKELFYELLIKKLTNFVVHFSKINTNPINYL